MARSRLALRQLRNAKAAHWEVNDDNDGADENDWQNVSRHGTSGGRAMVPVTRGNGRERERDETNRNVTNRNELKRAEASWDEANWTKLNWKRRVLVAVRAGSPYILPSVLASLWPFGKDARTSLFRASCSAAETAGWLQKASRELHADAAWKFQ